MDNKRLTLDLLQSSTIIDSTVCAFNDLLNWIKKCNNTIDVEVKEASLDNQSFWFYSENKKTLTNTKNAFFSVVGITDGNNEQPIILQNEIGFLGIVAKRIDGVIHFLMQAKIEPGNINHVQISPTIQATRSNFLRLHGGKEPLYLSYFKNPKDDEIIYDQIQSEQASRFFKKRNRNMILLVEKGFETVPDNFKWMTLGQIKKMLTIDNLVNMDTRTVISGLPLSFSFDVPNEIALVKSFVKNESVYNSFFGNNDFSYFALKQLNDYRMFHSKEARIIDLIDLKKWVCDNRSIWCLEDFNFGFKFYDVLIRGREVETWSQPLCVALGKSTFALLQKEIDGELRFLIKVRHEIGSFDCAEFGPSIQWEPTNKYDSLDLVGRVAFEHIKNNMNIKLKVVLSEEGGRFYQEENNNYIIEVKEELPDNIEGYLWVNYKTLNTLVRFNNVLNIQLRSLISLIDLR